MWGLAGFNILDEGVYLHARDRTVDEPGVPIKSTKERIKWRAYSEGVDYIRCMKLEFKHNHDAVRSHY